MFLKEDFETPIHTDDECRRRYGTEFGYCRYEDAEGEYTVALLGDSHALFAFPSVSQYLNRQRVNSLLIGRSGANNPVNSASANTDLREKMFDILRTDSSIKKVFLITRSYVSHRRSITELQVTQHTIGRLNEMGKIVYLVAENPLWPDMENIPLWMLLYQPLRDLFHPVPKIYKLSKKEVFEHQKEYLEMLSRLDGVTLLHTIDAFCPHEECLLFNEEGLPLYWNDNHLSQRTGGQFLLEKVLKPHLQMPPE
jgi:hypothetical protein